MGTLVYSPDIRVRIQTAAGIVDVSKDLTAGSLTLNANSPHQANLTISNFKRKYDGVFTPNDKVVIHLKRIRWVQVFSGYLDQVPYESVWTRSIKLRATCTLKRVLQRLYDAGAQPTVDIINQTAAGQAAPGTDGDDKIIQRAKDLLIEIAEWDEDKIHIAKLPSNWLDSITELYEKVAPHLEVPADVMAKLMGGGSIGGAGAANLGPGDYSSPDGTPTIMGPNTHTISELVAFMTRNASERQRYALGISREQLVGYYLQLGAAEGVRGDMALCQAIHETGGFSSNGAKRDNNYAGIGHYTGASRGHGFPTPQVGVLAQIQFLKKCALGNDAPLNSKSVVANQGLKFNPKTFAQLGPAGYATDRNYPAALTRMWQSLTSFSGKQAATTAGGGSGLVSKIGQFLNQSGGTMGPPANPATQRVFPVPGYSIGNRDFGMKPHPILGGARMHSGVDISAPQGTVMVAAASGTLVQRYSSGYGNMVEITTATGEVLRYAHIMNGGYIAPPGPVTAGQPIAKVGSTGQSTGPHLHFEVRIGGKAVDPRPWLAGAATEIPPGGFPDSNMPGMGSEGLFSASLPFAELQDLSSMLTGHRALMNDKSLFPAIRDLLGAGMRSFCSAPNGDFIAWFPDYFDSYGQLGTLTLESVELIDFTMDWSDTGFVTHQFVTGSSLGYGNLVHEEALRKMVTTMGVASIELPGLIEAIVGEVEGWDDADTLLRRHGARVDVHNAPVVTSPEAEFFLAIYLFMQAWANQFHASTPISFMPEAWPGMLLKIPEVDLQVYIRQVNHTFSMTDGVGFSTSVDVVAPSSLTGKIKNVPRAGGLSRWGKKKG